jgi:hypothetical protein
MMRYILFVFLLTGAAAAQFTTVSGTVTDPNGVPYANGTIAAILSTTASPTLGGFPYSPPTQPAGLNGAGKFIMQLADNTLLSPAGTKWNFTVCSAAGTVAPSVGTGPQCFSLAAPITISGVTQDITTQLHAVALALTIPIGGGGGGNISPGTGSSQSVTWNTGSSLWVPTQTPKFDLSNPNFGFNCNGTAYNTSAAAALVATIAGTPAAIIGPPGALCGIGDFVWPSNILLDFSSGWKLKTLTDSTTTPGLGQFNTTGAATGHCESNNTSPTCAMPVTATVGDAYFVACMRGFSSGAPVFTSNVASDIIIPIQGSSRSFVSITEGAIIPNVVSGAHTLTATFASNLVGACTAVPISGLGPTPFLVGTTGVCSNVSPNSPISCTGTFPAGTFLLFWGGQNNSSETCGAVGAGFTIVPGAAGCSTNTASNLAVAYLNSAAGGSVTPTIAFTPTPAGHFWSSQVIGLAPSSAYNNILGGIDNPAAGQIFVNANGTSSQGSVDLTGSNVIPQVRPEWWGASPSASDTTNLQALQAAIWAAYGNGPFAPRINGSQLSQYNRELYLNSMYHINGELKVYSTNGFKITCLNRLATGITQDAVNARIIDGQSNSYGSVHTCAFVGTTSTLPLIDWDFNGINTPNDLRPQFLDVYSSNFTGSGTAQGLLIAKSGGGSQGNNVNLYDPLFSGFTVAGLQIGTLAAFAQNAVSLTVYNGDFQGNPNFGFADYGGGYVQFFGTTMENGGFNLVTQTGADYFCSSPQGPIVIYDSRSESRKFIWCDVAEVHDSRTIDQALLPVPGTTDPVGSIITGDYVTGDGAYYNVTSNSSAFNGAGTVTSFLTASSGTSTTIADTNQTVAGAVTIGSFGVTNSELMTQAVSGSTATRLNNPVSNATITGTLTSGSFAFGDTAQQATTGVTCTIGSGNTSTVFNCSNFSGAADGSHVWTDLTTAGTFTPSGVPVFAAASPVMLITAATGSPDSTHDWVGGTTGLHYTPSGAPVNQAAWTVNGFTGLTVGVLTGTNALCVGTITSNTATAVTFSGGYTTPYPNTTCAANADTTTHFLVGCPWSHSGTVTCGGMQYQYLNEDVVRGNAVGTSMQGRIEDSYFAGGQVVIATGAAAHTVVKNLTVTRSDWYDAGGGGTPGQFGDNDNSWDVRVLPLGASIPKSWSLPRIGGGGTYAGGLHENWGTRALCWITGTIGTSNPPANTSGAETCVGGSNDSGGGSDTFRNRVTVFSGTGQSAIGPQVPTGTDQAGIDFNLLGGGSTGAGPVGSINFKIGATGASGTTPNGGSTRWRIDGATSNFFAQNDNVNNIGAAGSNRPANVFAAQFFRGAQVVSDQGTACTNGELALSAGWGTTATVTAVVGNGQTCEWTLTSSGTGQAANPTITDTLTNSLPAATTVCEMRMVGGTGTPTLIDQTTLSATAPIFTFGGTPAAASTYKVVRRCGP